MYLKEKKPKFNSESTFNIDKNIFIWIYWFCSETFFFIKIRFETDRNKDLFLKNTNALYNSSFLETPVRALEPDLQGSIQKQLPFAKKIPITQDG